MILLTIFSEVWWIFFICSRKIFTSFIDLVIVIGDSGVGKTNLLLRFVKNEFEYETHPTIGIDFTTKTVELDEKNIKVQIWDTAGQDRFKSISTAYYNYILIFLF